MQPGVRYLSAADLDALKPSATEASAAIDRFYRLQAEGRVYSQPKLTLTLGPGHLFQSLCCAVSDPSFAVCKWIGVSSRNSEVGLPNVNGIAILSNSDTGRPLGILDGAALTAIRTAATSLSAALRLASRAAHTIGFVGTGVQAHSHLALFAQAFAQLREVRILAGFRGAEGLQKHAQALGLRPVLCDSPRSAIEVADIVVTSVPATGGGAVLDARWLHPGAFVSSVDLGRSWLPDALSSFDLLATDDHENSAGQQAQGIMPAVGSFRCDLAELVSGEHPGRTNDRQRIAFIFPGFALSDLALATYFYEVARRRDVGTEVAL